MRIISTLHEEHFGAARSLEQKEVLAEHISTIGQNRGELLHYINLHSTQNLVSNLVVT